MCLFVGLLTAYLHYQVWTHRDCVICRFVTRNYRIGEALWFERRWVG